MSKYYDDDRAEILAEEVRGFNLSKSKGKRFKNIDSITVKANTDFLSGSDKIIGSSHEFNDDHG